jgi:hypothetical protein
VQDSGTWAFLDEMKATREQQQWQSAGFQAEVAEGLGVIRQQIQRPSVLNPSINSGSPATVDTTNCTTIAGTGTINSQSY